MITSDIDDIFTIEIQALQHRRNKWVGHKKDYVEK